MLTHSWQRVRIALIMNVIRDQQRFYGKNYDVNIDDYQRVRKGQSDANAGMAETEGVDVLLRLLA